MRFYVVSWYPGGRSADVSNCETEDALVGVLRGVYDRVRASNDPHVRQTQVRVFAGEELAVGGRPRGVTLADGRRLVYGEPVPNADWSDSNVVAPEEFRGG